MRRCFDHIPRDTPILFLHARSASHFSASCRVFRVALRAKLARFEMLFVPYSAFFTRFLVLRGTRGVCFADFSQLLPLEPFDSARALSPSLPRKGLGAFPGAQARFETGKIKLRPRASTSAIQNAAGPPESPLNHARGPRGATPQSNSSDRPPWSCRASCSSQIAQAKARIWP